MTKSSLSLLTCSENHIKEWMFFDLCASANRSITELDQQNSYSISSSFTNIFSIDETDHEVSAGIHRLFFEDYEHNIGTLNWKGSFGTAGAIGVSLSLGEPVDGHLSLNNEIRASYANILFDRPTQIFASRTFYDGGNFFNVDREDERLSIGFNTKLNDTFSVGVSAVRNISTVDFYNYDSISLDIGVTGYRF